MESEIGSTQSSQNSFLPDLCRDSPPSYAEAVVIDQPSAPPLVVNSPEDEISETDSTAAVITGQRPTDFGRPVNAFSGPRLSYQSQILFRMSTLERNPPSVLSIRYVEWKHNPVLVMCPFCQRRVLTQTRHLVEKSTLFMARVMNFVLGCVAWRFKFFPDVAHSCPFCKSHLGTFFYNANNRRR